MKYYKGKKYKYKKRKTKLNKIYENLVCTLLLSLFLCNKIRQYEPRYDIRNILNTFSPLTQVNEGRQDASQVPALQEVCDG